MDKLTAWIKCRDQQPTLPGWYDVWWHGDNAAEAESNKRLYWDGKDWRGSLLGTGSKIWTDDAWRGLSENPSAPKEAK